MVEPTFDFDNPIFQRAATYEEVARFVNTDPLFVIREVKRGKLRAHKFNARTVRIFPADLLRWLEAAGKPTNKAENSEPVTA